MVRDKFTDLYHGQWLSESRQVAIRAIRIFNSTNMSKDDFIERVSTLHQIHHDYVLSIFGVCMEPEKYALILQYMALGSLYDVLSQKMIKLAWCDRQSIALQMIKSINYLHTLPKPVIHGHIKPQHFLIDKHGQDFLVKVDILDLTTILRENSDKIFRSRLVGHLRWTAPELYRTSGLTKAGDVYALGVVLWQLATGCEPYENMDDSSANGAPYAEKYVRSSLSKEKAGVLCDILSNNQSILQEIINTLPSACNDKAMNSLASYVPENTVKEVAQTHIEHALERSKSIIHEQIVSALKTMPKLRTRSASFVSSLFRDLATSLSSSKESFSTTQLSNLVALIAPYIYGGTPMCQALRCALDTFRSATQNLK
ncbi:unnamed protein product, partial [Rotaria magnacalcarata]